MSRVSIKRIELTDFKGQHEKEILLNGTNAIVAGKNGSGKTTLADSWYWTMDDKDYLLKNNPCQDVNIIKSARKMPSAQDVANHQIMEKFIAKHADRQ